MIEISQLVFALYQASDIYQCSGLITPRVLRHCVTVTNALFGSRVNVTSTASLNLYLAPHSSPPRGFFVVMETKASWQQARLSSSSMKYLPGQGQFRPAGIPNAGSPWKIHHSRSSCTTLSACEPGRALNGASRLTLSDFWISGFLMIFRLIE